MNRYTSIASLRLCASALMICLCAKGQTSNVETVRAWTRTHVMGLPGGTLRDPTGTIAEGQRLAAASAIIGESSNIVAAAALGLSNALQRLWGAADETNKFTGRMYLAADAENDPDYENIESFVVREVYESNTVHYFCHYTRLLEEPPTTVWRFSPAPGAVYWASGTIDTNATLTNIAGYACYDIVVQRPAQAEGILLRTHKYMMWGTDDTPLDIPDAGLELVCGGITNVPYTGSVTCTNAAQTEAVTKTYLSGFLYTVATNQIGGVP